MKTGFCPIPCGDLSVDLWMTCPNARTPATDLK